MPTPIVWKDEDGNEHSLGVLLPNDFTSEALITIDTSHHHIQHGYAFTVEHNNSNGSGTKATISFTTPDTDTQCHLVASVRSNVEVFYTLHEGAVMAAAGADYLARNLNRRVERKSEVTSAGSTGGDGYVTLGGTISSEDLILETIHFGSGKLGGEGRSMREWVLKRNTTYALEVESEAASSEVTVEAHWYEITPPKHIITEM